MSQTTAPPSYLVTAAEVSGVENLSGTFRRIELASPDLADFFDGPLFDLRIKLIFPGASGQLPHIDPADPNWYFTWLTLPDDERGRMRTYTVRELRTGPEGPRLVIDFALHEAEDLGPGSQWALSAAPGDQVLVFGPRRGSEPGGIEFVGSSASSVLIVGDETAVPAVAGILRDLPASARGDVVLEVPTGADVQELRAPDGVQVHWRPRDGAERGSEMLSLVAELAADGLGRALPADATDDLTVDSADEIDPDLWETPRYSSATGQLVAEPTIDSDFYAWIAGEAKVVTGLRRYLVKDLGVDRSQVAFMGYWRDGVAMKG